MRREERFSCYSHLLGAVCAVVGTAALWLLAADGRLRAVGFVYGASMAFMFSASAVYHAKKDGEDGQSIWRRLDHVAIFFMIAGSYTPICWVHLQGAWRWSILAIQWGLVLLGLVFKLLFLRSPRWITVGIYVVMGWIVVLPLRQLLSSWSVVETALMAAGGASYTLGGVIYALKRPDPWPGRFGFHEIFHVTVMLGALLHYLAIVGMIA
jgi:hemolysin III